MKQAIDVFKANITDTQNDLLGLVSSFNDRCHNSACQPLDASRYLIFLTSLPPLLSHQISYFQ